MRFADVRRDRILLENGWSLRAFALGTKFRGYAFRDERCRYRLVIFNDGDVVYSTHALSKLSVFFLLDDRIRSLAFSVKGVRVSYDYVKEDGGEVTVARLAEMCDAV